MNTYTYKGKVACLNVSDKSTVATWFKELSVEALSEEEAQQKLMGELKAEYEDANITIEHSMQLVDAQINTATNEASAPAEENQASRRFRI